LIRIHRVALWPARWRTVRQQGRPVADCLIIGKRCVLDTGALGLAQFIGPLTHKNVGAEPGSREKLNHLWKSRRYFTPD
jgi:hypothetical protein